MAQSKYTKMATIADELQSLEREEDAQLLSFPDHSDSHPAAAASASSASHGATALQGSGSGTASDFRSAHHDPDFLRASERAPGASSAATRGPPPAQPAAPESDQFFTLHTLPADFLCLTEPVPLQPTRAHGRAGAPPPHARMGPGGPQGGGLLTVELVQARLAKNYGFMRMDPYVRLSVGIDHLDSAVCPNGGKEPRWNERIQIGVPTGYTTLTLEIFDQSTLGGDKLIATGTVSLERLLSGGPPYEDWFPLSGQQGEDKEGQINMHLSYAPCLPAAPYGFAPFAPAPFPGPFPLAPYAPVPYAQPFPPAPYPAPAPLPPAPPRTSEADISGLCDMFPGLGREVVETVLIANRGDREATVTALLALAT